jgi:hypothetical protein
VNDSITITNLTDAVVPASWLLANDIGASLSISGNTPAVGPGGFNVDVTPNGTTTVNSFRLQSAGAAFPNGSFTYTLKTLSNLTSTATVDLTVINFNSPDSMVDSTIPGTPGIDLLAGGQGSDTLTGGASPDLFIYNNRNNVTGVVNATSAGIADAIDTQNMDVITDFTGGEDKFGFDVSGFDGGNPLFNGSEDVLLTVQSGASVDTDILPNGAYLFAYETAGSTYLIYDADSNNIAGDNSRVLAQLQGISGLGTLNLNDFLFYS